MAASQSLSSVEHAAALPTILKAGFLAGLFDGMDAAIFIGLIRGAGILRVFQFIASGLIGPRSFQGGWSTGLLGVAVHFTVATGAAATYYLLAVPFPVLIKKPVLFGPLFGIAVFFFMHYGVVAWSAAPKRPFGTVDFINQILAHIFCVGLTIALMTRHEVLSRR